MTVEGHECTRRGNAERYLRVLGDAAQFTDEPRFDLVFSNAAIQWIPHHKRLVPRLLSLVAEGGALAEKIPLYDGMPVRRAISDVASSERWRERMAESGRR